MADSDRTQALVVWICSSCPKNKPKRGREKIRLESRSAILSPVNPSPAAAVSPPATMAPSFDTLSEQDLHEEEEEEIDFSGEYLEISWPWCRFFLPLTR